MSTHPIRIHCVTLPVDDLKRSITFYREGLGMKADDVPEGADHLPLLLPGGLYLVLTLRSDFTSFTQLAGRTDAPKGTVGCILSFFTANRNEVDTLLQSAGPPGGAVSGPGGGGGGSGVGGRGVQSGVPRWRGTGAPAVSSPIRTATSGKSSSTPTSRRSPDAPRPDTRRARSLPRARYGPLRAAAARSRRAALGLPHGLGQARPVAGDRGHGALGRWAHRARLPSCGPRPLARAHSRALPAHEGRPRLHRPHHPLRAAPRAGLHLGR